MTVSQQNVPKKFDVIVIGGGFVGGFMAVAAANRGFRVLILEARQPRQLDHTDDVRTSAIAWGTSRLLAAMGVWDDKLSQYAEPINDITITDAGSSADLHFAANDLPGEQPMGYIIDNFRMHEALARALTQLPHVTWKHGVTVKTWDAQEHAVAVTACEGENTETFWADIVVGADGRQAWSRQHAQISTLEFAYQQKALVCRVAHEHHHQGLAHEHFMAAGPVALLPMQGQCSTLVWSTHPAAAEHLAACPEDVFDGALNAMAARFNTIRGRMRVDGPRQCYPLRAVMLERIVAERFVVIGDAAHTMHPVAGQGLNLGIRDVAELVEALSNARDTGHDIGSQMVLKQYQRQRRPDHVALVGMTHGLVRIFSQPSPYLAQARGLGIRLVGALPPLRRLLMRRAMGIARQR